MIHIPKDLLIEQLRVSKIEMILKKCKEISTVTIPYSNSRIIGKNWITNSFQ